MASIDIINKLTYKEARGKTTRILNKIFGKRIRGIFATAYEIGYRVGFADAWDYSECPKDLDKEAAEIYSDGIDVREWLESQE